MQGLYVTCNSQNSCKLKLPMKHLNCSAGVCFHSWLRDAGGLVFCWWETPVSPKMNGIPLREGGRLFNWGRVDNSSILRHFLIYIWMMFAFICGEPNGPLLNIESWCQMEVWPQHFPEHCRKRGALWVEQVLKQSRGRSRFTAAERAADLQGLVGLLA